MDFKNFKKTPQPNKIIQPTTAGIFSTNREQQRHLNYNGENSNSRKLG